MLEIVMERWILSGKKYEIDIKLETSNVLKF